MEGPISFWGYKEQESNLNLPEHDDDDDDDDDDILIKNYFDFSVALSLWVEDYYTIGYFSSFVNFIGSIYLSVARVSLMSSAVSMATCIDTKHCSGLRSVPHSWRVSEVGCALPVSFLVYCVTLHKAHNITCYISHCLTQRCTSPGYQIAMATKFCAVASNICGSSVGNEDNIKMDFKEF